MNKTIKLLLSICFAAIIISLPNHISAQQTDGSEIRSNPGMLSEPVKTDKVDSIKTNSVEDKVKQGELPFSRLYEFIKPSPEKEIRLSKLSESQKRQPSNEKRMKVGVTRDLITDISRVSRGTSFQISEGKIWTVNILVEDAVQVRLYFEKMNLLPGARVFVYSEENPDEVYNFDINNNSEDTGFWTPPVEGKNIIIEYFVLGIDKGFGDILPFQITKVSDIFTDPLQRDSKTNLKGATQFSCHNNVPQEWSVVGSSVGHLQFVDGSVEYVCTGTLLSNTANDYDPILLTANHCISTQASAQSLRVYWQYNSGDFPTNATPLSEGATLLATGTSSDYTLMRIIGKIPIKTTTFFWSGWDANPVSAGVSVTGIHHPSGSYKRYSTGSSINTFCPYGCTNYTGVQWQSGTTEGGSSGSGLWTGNSTNARLVGTLSGGETGCGIRDSYGNFSVTFTAISSFLQEGPDDNFDSGTGNDVRTNATTLSRGSYKSLIAKYQDEDWYKITIPHGGHFNILTSSTNISGDIDAELYQGNQSSPIKISRTISNYEFFEHLNLSGSTQDYFIRIYINDGVRNTYDMDINIDGTENNPCSAVQVNFPQTIEGSLTNTDCTLSESERYTDFYSFEATAGQKIAISLDSSDFDPRLVLLNSDYRLVADDSDGGEGNNARIPANSGYFTIPATGVYLIRIIPYLTGDVGNYTLKLITENSSSNNPDTAGVFRPSNGITYLRNSNTGGFADINMVYGVAGDTSIAGDWDGNGKDSLGIYRNGLFYLRNSNTTGPADIVFAFGSPGDQPIAGDWDGDGIDTIGVYRQSTGVFILRNSNSLAEPDTVFVLGNPGDVAIAGDWNGDGITTTGVFRPSNGIIYLKNTNVSGIADIYLVYGNAGDKPLAGDWDGDGKDSVGIYRNGVMYLRNSNTQGVADIVFAFGNPGDEPIAGDWDGLP